MRLKATESEIQRCILDLLAAERIWALRINTSAAVLTDARGKKRFLRSHSGGAGVADILATVARTAGGFDVLHIEVKSQDGRQSALQAEFEAFVKKQGHAYLLARSVDDVTAWLKDHRAIR